MKKKQKTKTSVPKVQKQPTVETLATITDKRTGGSVNITGITFQTLYAVHSLLKEFGEGGAEIQIRLEGLEDIDLNKGKLTLGNSELIQLKTSINSLDAAGFWEMGVLKNFLEVYDQDKDFQFRFVYNMSITTGHLENLIASKLNDASEKHWHDKIKTLKQYKQDLDIPDFLSKISFEKITAEKLYEQSVNLLLDKYGVNPGTEQQYLKSLFYCALEWSKDRATIGHTLWHQTVQQVTDALYKGPVNPAVLNGWITPVEFQLADETSGSHYFEGKAARPGHIAQQLPARRPVWEKHIQELLLKTDVVVIKSSSGQGKSTLAWQTAFNESGQYAIYQLSHAQQAEYTEPIVELIKSRVKIGETPLIILDGLDKQLQYWSSVVARTTDLPVKFLITTREEDWYAFGNDISRIKLQIININLTEEEAKNIYQQFREKNKLHPENRNWQTPWEKVKEKGLLIEYAYLLTRGQMFGERLDQQVKKLNAGERNSAAKIELLRIIGVADILGLKVKSNALIMHVQQLTGITGDRGELLKELELEYFIRIGEQHVEGLHPVRSAHLVKLLHGYVAIEETLMALLAILEPIYYEQFASTALDHLEPGQKLPFLKQVAWFMAGKDLTDMVAVIDGLMKREPQRYWETNRHIFDDVFQNGGIEIFIVDTLPFMHLNMIANLLSSFGEEYNNPSVLQEKLNSLTKYDFQESDVAQFIRLLQDALSRILIKGHQGLSSLLKWTNKVTAQNSIELDIKEDDLLAAMKTEGLEAAGELFFYFRKTYPERYRAFTGKNKEELFSWLKMRTDTVLAEEKEDGLYLQYIFDPDDSKVNEQSVNRIERFHSFLPDYEKYHTELIYLPFPNDELYKVTRMDAHKAMPAQNLHDPFEVAINQTWSNTILKNYDSESVYDWQNELVKLRKTGLDFVKRCTQFLEFVLEQNEQRKKVAIGPLIQLSDQVLALIRTRKRFPDQNKRNQEPEFKEHYRNIDEWALGLQNFINQFSKIVLNEEHQHIAMINLKKMVMKLPAAQHSFHAIAGKGIRYFELVELEAEELSWYGRLRATVEHLVVFRDTKISFAKAAIKTWWDHDQLDRLHILKEGLKMIGASSELVFHAPTAIREDEYGKTAVIGVEGLPEEYSEADQHMLNMIWTIVPLATLDIVTYDLILIRKGITTGGIRVQKAYLDTLMHFNDTGEFEPSEFGNPIPITPEQETISLLEGVNIPDMTALNITQDYSKVIIDLWRFQKYRENIDPDNAIENTWLGQLTTVYSGKITGYLSNLKEALLSDYEELAEMFDQVVQQGRDFEMDVYLNALTAKVTEVNRAIHSHINKL